MHLETNDLIHIDKMIASELLKGIPLLVLANKQDLQDSMGVREVKPIFNQNAHLIGQRDCMVMPVSALNGCEYFIIFLFEFFCDKVFILGMEWMKESNGLFSVLNVIM
jgi:hypothetical protein